MNFRNRGIGSFGCVVASIPIALALAGVASADEATSNGYYIGGLIGLGVGQSIGGDNLISSLAPGSIDNRPPLSSTPVGNVEPSFSLLLGKSWSVANRFSAGLEFEGEYQGARGNSSASNGFGFAPGAFGESYENDQASSQWSVPAQAALRARVSFEIAPNVSLYGSLGPALGYAHINASISEDVSGYTLNRQTFQTIYFNNVYNASGGKWVVDPGFSLGTGVEVAVAPNLSLRGEYSLAAFKSISATVPDAYAAATVKVTPLFQGVRLGLVRHF
jgi:opacity protein-like surface antigen